jgi:peptide deformylase
VIEGEGLLAQALQHECDHLDGKLYINRLDREARGEAMRRIRGSSWF